MPGYIAGFHPIRIGAAQSSSLNVRRAGGLYHRASGWHKPSAPEPEGPSGVENLSPDDELSNENLRESQAEVTCENANGAAMVSPSYSR